jgi:nucleoside-diphosphate-sugar epimerase
MTKIIVIGGTGLIGSKLVARLAERGHEAIAASPKSGVNTLTGVGLPRCWPARRSSSTSPTHPRSRTK